MGKMTVYNHFKEADIKKREQEILQIIIRLLEKSKEADKRIGRE